MLSPLARADLDEIWEYSVRQWGVAQAETYITEIAKVIKRVAAHPNIGRCDDIRLGYFRIPAGSHVLFYRRDKEKIVVVRILHQRMDVQRHL